VTLDDAALYDDGAFRPKLVKEVCCADDQMVALSTQFGVR
jgi:hypothetical protein